MEHCVFSFQTLEEDGVHGELIWLASLVFIVYWVRIWGDLGRWDGRMAWNGMEWHGMGCT